MEKLIEQIIELEWEFFQSTNNEGGTASCQEDHQTFVIMRGAQFSCFSRELLQSWLRDLQRAKEEGRNLIAEKYARMMESTAPERYRELAPYLIQHNAERLAITEEIIKIQVEWLMECQERYPAIIAKARPIHTSEDTPYDTSAETYLRGELGTYSDETLLCYGRYVVSLKKEGQNLNEMICEKEVKSYGYLSLDDAEKQEADLISVSMSTDK